MYVCGWLYKTVLNEGKKLINKYLVAGRRWA